MNLDRRDFLKTTFAASATAALSSQLSAAETPAPSAPAREYYELRCYHLKAGTRLKADADPALLDSYLEHALLPALEKRGVKNTGIFTEVGYQSGNYDGHDQGWLSSLGADDSRHTGVLRKREC